MSDHLINEGANASDGEEGGGDEYEPHDEDDEEEEEYNPANRGSAGRSPGRRQEGLVGVMSSFKPSSLQRMESVLSSHRGRKGSWL